jgi:carboxymethylenebutenolidase
MGGTVQLTAKDSHHLDAYVARPAGSLIAGLVVVQEIYGVNSHIRSVADAYAQDGFLVVAPALFDRVERDVQLGYGNEDRQRAIALLRKLKPESALLDIEAALAWVRGDSKIEQAGVVGYCFGGTMAWRSAAQLDPQAAVGYYAGGIGDVADLTPHCPVMLHFGRLDAHIPRSAVEKVHTAHPEVEIHWYDAGHGFNCEARESYDAAAAELARSRSLEFLKKNLR